MTCTNCGEPLEPSDTFCTACGTGVGEPLEADAVIDPAGEATPEPDLPPGAQLGRRASARVLDMLLLIAVLTVLAIPFTDDVVNDDGETVVEVDPIVVLIAVVVVFAYEVGFVGWRAQTPG